MTLTAVPGVRVGHASDLEARTGCTVIIGPFRAACDVRGLATGTRELDALSPHHLVPAVDAIVLTGGSAFGLDAAGGVAAWLEERGFGFPTGAARVPIVPAAVIYDLGVGRADRRPDAAMGRAACDAASDAPVAEGAIGAGTGATVGKILGPDGASPSGVGSWALRSNGFVVGALAVVNAVGDVRAADGRILAGARGPDGAFVDTSRYLRDGTFHGGFGSSGPVPGTNTTLAVVATDAPLTRTALEMLARMAATGVSRRITPVHTPFDGDVTFAASTASEIQELSPATLLALGAAAAHAVEVAVERAVLTAAGAPV
ncbi:MAG: P1 family peptidase [Gemmatimonadetes bacterium]|nr:P1 family peptidase [Gemmatimonadota bacterium]